MASYLETGETATLTAVRREKGLGVSFNLLLTNDISRVCFLHNKMDVKVPCTFKKEKTFQSQVRGKKQEAKLN